jgi:APA family basic amino acid/polyamine antiporter
MVRPYHMRRVLGVPALYSAGYGNVGSSIYYALGVVALVAMGATPVALGVAGILFLFTVLTYAEGSAMFPEAGGSASFARHAFNDLAGFISGWALMLSYIVTIAISAFIIPPYLGHFYEPLKTDPVLGTAMSMGIVLFLMVLNVLGVRETSFVNIFAATIDLFTQLFLIVLGFAFLFDPGLLVSRIVTYWPGQTQLIFGVALAALAYTGVETVSQMAEETRRPQTRVPQALMLMVVTVLVMFVGVTMVAFSTMTPGELATNWAKDPIAGIAHFLPLQLASYTPEGPVASVVFVWFVDLLQRLLPPMVALLAGTILLIATNAGLIGISRLAFSLGRHRQLPSAFSRVHRRFKTPYVAIITFSAVALLILVPGMFQQGFLTALGALYTFGSLLSFAIAHLSIMALRVKQPQLPRPFHRGPNLRVGGREIPVTALLGFLATALIWGVIVTTQPYSRWVGFAWMGAGLVFYLLYRRAGRLPLVSVPEKPRGPL